MGTTSMSIRGSCGSATNADASMLECVAPPTGSTRSDSTSRTLCALLLGAWTRRGGGMSASGISHSIAPHGDAAEGTATTTTKPSAMPSVVAHRRTHPAAAHTRVWFLFLQATTSALPHSAQWELSWQQTLCDSGLGVDNPRGAANGGG
ncbi:hypothetical protein ZEAMMB73_Zm00001d011214 [Zea mays]|uniref:Uncharacterized protein n=1 Tax=Zea mays TaxID=4577 RepID=A0A1D6FY03_MAIZE|nr:hypothetical protein ZEAMMB73_Zm00001d011214 [Zea mays]AQK96230.1 hypothetical protein ZEAMMB73_Zm00001d011214 [Zea mays]